MFEGFVVLLVLAVVCEAVVEWIKELFPDLLPKQVKMIIALAVGLVLATGAGQNLFVLLGITFAYPIVGYVIAGLLISRGSNYIHDFITMVRGEQESVT